MPTATSRRQLMKASRRMRTTGVTTVRTSCAGCHTGQGFLQWYKQLANVGGGRKVGSRTLDATTLANLGWNSTGTLTSSGATVIRDAAVPGVVTKANVQPQTCAVCHDPHDEGTVTTAVPGGINNAKVRVTDNTSLLPGGFIANGVGRGALCITCHNSRNGEPRLRSRATRPCMKMATLTGARRFRVRPTGMRHLTRQLRATS